MLVRRNALLGAGLIVLLAAFVGYALLIMTMTVDRLLHRDAEITGYGWARYLAQNVKDLDRIVAGKPPMAESMAFFEKAQQVGQVFRYKIFDPEGNLRLVSDELSEIGKPAQSIAVHNPHAASVLRTGRPSIEAKEGVPPKRPAFFAEAYVPVVVDGRTIAIVEAYVDQAEKRAAFRSQLGLATLSLGVLTALAFGMPAAGFFWRTRQQQLDNERLDRDAQRSAASS